MIDIDLRITDHLLIKFDWLIATKNCSFIHAFGVHLLVGDTATSSFSCWQRVLDYQVSWQLIYWIIKASKESAIDIFTWS